MEDRTFFQPVHRPHQMQVRCVRYLYHRTLLHSQHMLRNVLSYAVFLRTLQHLHIMEHTLYIQGLFLCKFQESRKLEFLLFQAYQELYPVMLLPYSKHNRQQLLLYSKSLLGLHKELRYLEVSKVLLSMQGNTHLHQPL